jgi:hypothetical protein
MAAPVDMPELRMQVVRYIQQTRASSVPPRVRITKAGELVVRIR